MSKRTFQLLSVTCLVAATLWAADDPFVGKWKLNPSKSQLTDQMKVEALGANKYTFDFGGGIPETVVADRVVIGEHRALSGELLRHVGSRRARIEPALQGLVLEHDQEDVTHPGHRIAPGGGRVRGSRRCKRRAREQREQKGFTDCAKKPADTHDSPTDDGSSAPL